jgi:hypothetical protein
MEIATDAVFETAGQALYVSYLVMAHEARQGTPLRNAILRIMDDLQHPTKRQQEWMDQLRGDKGSSTVNFDGLSPDEVRGQCAMVTQAVKDHLTSIERSVIEARYIPVAEEDLIRDGQRVRRMYFPATRVAAMAAITDYLRAPRLMHLPYEAIKMMIGRLYSGETKMQISFNDLAMEFGGHMAQYKRANVILREALEGIEQKAMVRLTTLFISTGLISS